MLVRFLECTEHACGFRFPATEHDLARLDEGRCPRCRQNTRVVEIIEIGQEPYKFAPTAKDVVNLPISATLVDNVRSVFNIGSIFRSTEGAGIQHLHLCGITPTPEHPKLAKTALGAQNAVLWTQHNNSVTAGKALLARGFRLWALEEASAFDAHPAQASDRFVEAVSLFDLENSHVDALSTSPIALIIGNETAGIDPGLLALCERIVFIPMAGHKRSLNVAVAYGIAAFWLTGRAMHTNT